MEFCYKFRRGQVLNSEEQQSTLFTVLAFALHRRGPDTGHIVGPNLGQKLADKYSIQDQALAGGFIAQKQSWVKSFNPAPPPEARSGGDRAVKRGSNAGAGSTSLSLRSHLEPGAPAPHQPQALQRRSPPAPMPRAARRDPAAWLAAPPSLALSSGTLTIPIPGRWSR